MESRELAVDTSERRIVDLTDDVRGFCRDRGAGPGPPAAPPAAGGLALLETGAGSDDDLLETLMRLLPRDGRYRHRHGSPGHGADHLVPALISPSLVLPVVNGRPALGTWQSVALVDLNPDNPARRVRFSFLAG